MSTLQILESVVNRLKAKIPTLQVEFFPEKPEEFRLNHPRGALLVNYGGSEFAEPRELSVVMQPRKFRFSVTVLLRQLHGRGGAVEVLDDVRRVLAGFRPLDCRRKVYALTEQFITETAGIWQYAVDFATETMLVEVSEEKENEE